MPFELSPDGDVHQVYYEVGRALVYLLRTQVYHNTPGELMGRRKTALFDWIEVLLRTLPEEWGSRHQFVDDVKGQLESRRYCGVTRIRRLECLIFRQQPAASSSSQFTPMTDCRRRRRSPPKNGRNSAVTANAGPGSPAVSGSCLHCIRQCRRTSSSRISTWSDDDSPPSGRCDS
jgi:hypothetical protein